MVYSQGLLHISSKQFAPTDDVWPKLHDKYTCQQWLMKNVPIKQLFNDIHKGTCDNCSWAVPSKALPHRVGCCKFSMAVNQIHHLYKHPTAALVDVNEFHKLSYSYSDFHDLSDKITAAW